MKLKILEPEKKIKYLAQRKKYREKNKAKISKYAKEYYQLNKDKIAFYQKTEKFKKIRKKWREENKEKILIEKREYRKKNRQKLNDQSLKYYHKRMLDPEFRIKQKEKHLLYYNKNRNKRIEAVKKWRKKNPRKNRLMRIKSYLKSSISKNYEKW